MPALRLSLLEKLVKVALRLDVHVPVLVGVALEPPPEIPHDPMPANTDRRNESR